MNDEQLDKKIRELQTKKTVIVDCGGYTISRPLTYKEAKNIIKKKTLQYFIEE